MRRVTGVLDLAIEFAQRLCDGCTKSVGFVWLWASTVCLTIFFPADFPDMSNSPSLSLRELKELIETMYSAKDDARGVEGTFMWLMEEVGELAAALREGPKEELAKEFADVLAWLATIANVADIDLTAAVVDKYGSGCPGCGEMVCRCSDATKP